MGETIIYCDEASDEILAERYLITKKGPLRGATIERLPSLSAAPELLKPLLEWERLDWIVQVDGELRCTVEFSRHGYTGDNGFQRFARLYRSIDLEVPTIYFTPFSRTRLNELEEGRQSPRNVAPELFRTLTGLGESSGIPCLAMKWPTLEDGTPAPLNSDLGEPALKELCDVVIGLCSVDPEDQMASLEKRNPEVARAMRTQARLAFRGSATRRELPLPCDLTSPDPIFDWLPSDYFGSGKADKALASLALRRQSDRSVVGPVDEFWEGAGSAWCLFLGYQWRPDPASGLIALAAARAKQLGFPLVVIWPRVFYRDGDERSQLVSDLREFRKSGTGELADELRRLGKEASAIRRFRRRVSVDPKQFGVFSPDSKTGRILKETASALVLGDVVLTFSQ